MKISDYIKQEGISQAEFARRIGVDRSTVTLWIQGLRRPASDMALHIEQVTDGSIHHDELLYPKIGNGQRDNNKKMISMLASKL